MIRSIGYLSMHTSPLLQPGVGHAGGMNVYIHELAITMAGRGIEVVVFTRQTDASQPEVVHVADGYRVVHTAAGGTRPVPMQEMPELVPEFAESVIKWIYRDDTAFDVLHSHYWLSGWAGVLVKEAIEAPLANSFHTLGRVKDLTRRRDEPASSRMRTLTEEEVIAQSDCVIASTPYEFDDLLDHYGASPERLCTSPPGIDHTIFTPGDHLEERGRLGLRDVPTILFAGRIQALKGVDVAIEALGMISPIDGGLPELIVVGGPSGPGGDDELARLERLARDRGLAQRVHFVPPQPHDQLAAFYRAADVLVMPSRSESFGLVAAEAQACGLPVVAARIGGLPYVVDDGVSGLLVEGHDPVDYAEALSDVLNRPARAKRLREGALIKAREFSWDGTADRLIELYEGITGS